MASIVEQAVISALDMFVRDNFKCLVFLAVANPKYTVPTGFEAEPPVGPATPVVDNP